MMVNWEFFDNTTPEKAIEVVDRIRAGQRCTATRGARVCTWKQAERVLAGFPDGRADEGPTAVGPSLLGLTIARERGWSRLRARARGGRAGWLTRRLGDGPTC